MCAALTTTTTRAITNQTNKEWEKKIKTTYCLGRENYTHNFNPQELKMTNKVLRVKLNGVVARTTKSRFLKQIYNNMN